MQFGVKSMRTSFFSQSQLLRMPVPNAMVAALVCSQVYDRFVYGSTRISVGKHISIGMLTRVLLRPTFVVRKGLIFTIKEESPKVIFRDLRMAVSGVVEVVCIVILGCLGKTKVLAF